MFLLNENIKIFHSIQQANYATDLITKKSFVFVNTLFIIIIFFKAPCKFSKILECDLLGVFTLLYLILFSGFWPLTYRKNGK